MPCRCCHGRRCSSARCLPCIRTCLAKSWIWSLTAPQAGATTATVIGRVPAKLLMAVLMLVEAGLVLRFLGARALAAFLLLSAARFTLDATVIWRSRAYSNREMRFFMLAWNAAALIGMPWIWSQGSLLRMK